MIALQWYLGQTWYALRYSQYGLLAAVQTPLYIQALNIIANNPTPIITGCVSIITFAVSQSRKRETDTMQRQREAMTTWKDLAESLGLKNALLQRERDEAIRHRDEALSSITQIHSDTPAPIDKNLSDTED